MPLGNVLSLDFLFFSLKKNKKNQTKSLDRNQVHGSNLSLEWDGLGNERGVKCL